MSVAPDTLVEELLDPVGAGRGSVIAFTEMPADAERLLARARPEVSSRWLDLGDPTFGFNPLTAGGSVELLAADLACAVIGLSETLVPDPATQMRVRDAIRTAVESWRDSGGDDPPTFREVAAELESFELQPEVRGALVSLTMEPVDRLLRHPVQVPVEDLTRSGAALVVTAGTTTALTGPEITRAQRAVASLLVSGSTRAASANPARQPAPALVPVLVAANPRQVLLNRHLSRLGRQEAVEACTWADLEEILAGTRPAQAQPPLSPAGSAVTRRNGRAGHSERAPGVRWQQAGPLAEVRRSLRVAPRFGSITEREEEELQRHVAEELSEDQHRRRQQDQRRALAIAGAMARRESRRRRGEPRHAQINATQAVAGFMVLTIAIVIIAVIGVAGGLAVIEQQDAHRNGSGSPWSWIWHALFPKPLGPGEGQPQPVDPAPVELPIEVPVLVSQVTPDAASSIPSWTVPIFNEAARVFDVNPYLLASVADQESSFGTGAGWTTVNYAGCVGFMQTCVGGAGGDSWDSTVTLTQHPAASFPDRCAWTLGKRPASYPDEARHAGACPPDANYDDPFDGVMAAAAELRSKVGGQPIPNLDAVAYQALCGYYGACSGDGVSYAPTVLSRAQAWQSQDGFSKDVVASPVTTMAASSSTLEQQLRSVTASELAKVTHSQLSSGLDDLKSIVSGGPLPVVSGVQLAAFTSGAPTSAAAAAVAHALAMVGTPYQWGGSGPDGFDCSGLTQWAYRQAGIELPRVAQDQYDAGPRLPPGAGLASGDLVFFGTDASHVTHVGMVVSAGNGVQAEMVDAPHTGASVRTEPFPTTVGASWGADEFIGATRPSAARGVTTL